MLRGRPARLARQEVRSLALRLALAVAAGVVPAAAARASALSAPFALAALEAQFQGDARLCDSLLQQAEREASADPRLWLAHIHCGWWNILAGRDPQGTIEQALPGHFERLSEVARARLAADPTDDVAAFTLGEAHCTLGRLAALRGRVWGALRHHQQGIALLEAVCRRSPAAPEPRASLGVFRYYTARLPRSLRVVARVVRVRGDRAAGLADLRAAASAPGVQQVQGAFFLTQVLSHSEDETLEALALARLYHARYPRHMGFALELADVLVALERPDLALQALADAPPADPGGSGQMKLFSARVYLESGRPAAALMTLATLESAEREALRWLESWHAAIRGASQVALGRVAVGRADLEHALRVPDVAGSHDAARAARDRGSDPLAPASAAAESLLAWDGDPDVARRTLEVALVQHPDAAADAAFLYLLGSATLRAGDARAAAGHFAAAARADKRGEVRLHVRPAIRHLQALQWAGEVEAARDAARQLAPALGEWGTNRQLEWLVSGLLGSAPDPVRLQGAAPAPEGDLVRLKDTGFTGVAVRVRGACRPQRVPMSWHQGYWEARVPLAGAGILYGFEVESGEIVVDPEAREVVDREGILWCRPPAATRAS